MKLADMVAQSRSMSVLTGAGISTESGIPDFRSPGGIWSQYRPVTFPEFVSSDEARSQYWRRHVDMYPMFADVRPNAGHLALAEFERQGALTGLITQNVDGLHQAAGNTEEKVVELHGRVDRTTCLTCGHTWETKEIVDRVSGGDTAPSCDHCGGWLKPATISFGQSLPVQALEKATTWARRADLFLAIGSSLTVHPAASLPALAKESGARLVIINATGTPYDGISDLVIKAQAGPTLSGVIKRLYRSS